MTVYGAACMRMTAPNIYKLTLHTDGAYNNSVSVGISDGPWSSSSTPNKAFWAHVGQGRAVDPATGSDITTFQAITGTNTFEVCTHAVTTFTGLFPPQFGSHSLARRRIIVFAFALYRYLSGPVSDCVLCFFAPK